MAQTGPISAMQQAILGKSAWLETYVASENTIFNGLVEVITDKDKKFPTEGKPIVVRRDLKIHESLSQKVFMIGKLTGEGVDGDSALKGNEAAIDSYSQTISVKQKRQGVARSGYESEISAPVKFFPKFKPMLADWWANYKAKDYVRKAAGATTKTFANIPTAPSTNRNLWGSTATSTATIAATSAYILTDTLLLKAKTLAMNQFIAGTDGKYVPPIGKINMGGKIGGVYLLLTHPDCYNDLLTSSTVQQKYRETAALQANNPLLHAGDILLYDVLVRPCELLRESNVGQFTTWGSGANVAGGRNIFLGAGAIGCSEADAPFYRADMEDYENVKGVALGNVLGCQKAKYNGEDLATIAIDVYRAGL